MPVTALSDNKQSVKVLLMSGIQHAFLIPEYQRPYAWTFDQVDTLFSDIWDFTESTGGPEREATYFLGSIVSFINEKGEQEIIDGQQRITSLFLLLRAIYEKLTKGAQTEESKNFIKQIEQCIWRANKLTGKVNKNEILIRSEVVSKDGTSKIILRSCTTDCRVFNISVKVKFHFTFSPPITFQGSNSHISSYILSSSSHLIKDGIIFFLTG